MSRQKLIPVVLTPRDLLLFRTLMITRILGVAEVMSIARFASLRRANRRLLKLVRAGFLRRWFVPTEAGGQRALYGLSPQGAHRIGEPTRGLITWTSNSLITSSQFLAHQQAVNAIFIEAKFKPLPQGLTCNRWSTFNTQLSPSVPLVPDGYFELVYHGAVHPMFLEVDRGTETSKVWLGKAEHYLALATNGEFERLFQQKRSQLKVLVLFHSERRLAAVRRAIARRTAKLFWFTTQSEGLWKTSWLRPKASQKVGLLADPFGGE
jgi:hypothetical protein